MDVKQSEDDVVVLTMRGREWKNEPAIAAMFAILVGVVTFDVVIGVALLIR